MGKWGVCLLPLMILGIATVVLADIIEGVGVQFRCRARYFDIPCCKSHYDATAGITNYSSWPRQCEMQGIAVGVCTIERGNTCPK